MAAIRLTSDVLPVELQEKMTPEFIAPLVLYLCSDECPVNGGVYNAGMGFYNRVSVMTAPGVVMGEGKNIPTVEEIASGWDTLMSLKGAEEYEQLNDLVVNLIQAFGPGKA
jgi:hypothetical protein